MQCHDWMQSEENTIINVSGHLFITCVRNKTAAPLVQFCLLPERTGAKMQSLLLLFLAWAEFTVGLLNCPPRTHARCAACNNMQQDVRGQDWRGSARGRRHVGGSGGLTQEGISQAHHHTLLSTESRGCSDTINASA